MIRNILLKLKLYRDKRAKVIDQKLFKFSLTQKIFNKEFRPLYSDVNASKIIQYVFPLPFFIPYPPGHCITAKTGDDEFISVIFRDYSNIIAQGGFMRRVKATYIESIYYSSNDMPCDQLLEKVVSQVNIGIRSYMVAKKDWQVYMLNLHQLGVAVASREVQLENWAKKVSLDVLPGLENLKCDKQYLSSEDIENIARTTGLDVFGINPFVGIIEILLSAVRLKKEGFHRESIMLLQVFMEAFLSEMLKTVLIEEGRPNDSIQKIMNCGYKNIVDEHLFIKLAINKTDRLVEDYWTGLYDLRNKITHSGYNPSGTETQKVFDVAMEFKDFVVNKVTATRYLTLKELFSLR